MIKTFAIASALLLATATGSIAAEVGIRHSSGGSHTNTHSGRNYSSYEGSAQSSRQESGSARSVRHVGFFGTGGRDVTRSQYSGQASSQETFRGGSTSRFNGSAWNNFSETSTFVR